MWQIPGRQVAGASRNHARMRREIGGEDTGRNAENRDYGRCSRRYGGGNRLMGGSRGGGWVSAFST